MAENYLDLQEDKKVHEESLDYKKQRDEVVKLFQTLKTQLVALLEENIREPPLHQLSLSEFNLHLEHKKERLKAVCGFSLLYLLRESCRYLFVPSDYKYPGTLYFFRQKRNEKKFACTQKLSFERRKK